MYLYSVPNIPAHALPTCAPFLHAGALHQQQQQQLNSSTV
jgi:hypothetical protein